MLTVTIAARVDENGTVILKVPPQVSPGYHKMVLVIEEAELTEKVNGVHDSEPSTQNQMFVLPTHDVGAWPENFSLRREDLYDDWGR